MDVRTDRLFTLADGIGSTLDGVAPGELGDALTAAAGALTGSQTSAATSALAASLGDHLRRWHADLLRWADGARASAAGYDAVDQRARTRLDQVAV